GARERVEVVAHVDAERAEIADGRHGERQVRTVDRAANGEFEPFDGGLGPAHLLEQPAGDDEGARHRRGALHGGRRPAEGRLGFVRQQERERAVNRGVSGLGAGKIRRSNAHRIGASSYHCSRHGSLGSFFPDSERSMKALIALAVAATRGKTRGESMRVGPMTAMVPVACPCAVYDAPTMASSPPPRSPVSSPTTTCPPFTCMVMSSSATSFSRASRAVTSRRTSPASSNSGFSNSRS